MAVGACLLWSGAYIGDGMGLTGVGGVLWAVIGDDTCQGVSVACCR